MTEQEEALLDKAINSAKSIFNAVETEIDLYYQSEDYSRGFNNAHEILYNRILDALKSLKN